jgi:hypothetical protein
MSKGIEDYTKDLVRTQELIDLNLTRLIKVVSRIGKLRTHENYVWNKLAHIEDKGPEPPEKEEDTEPRTRKRTSHLLGPRGNK